MLSVPGRDGYRYWSIGQVRPCLCGVVLLLLQQEGDPTLEATELTWADQVVLRGRQEGRAEGVVLAMREDIRRVVRARFGSVPPTLESALGAMAREEELAALFDRALKAQRVDELM
jgi:hypothetical protein